MAGREQHFIPQFFQRGFGIPNGKKPVDIWVYRKGVAPEIQPIEETAVGFDFYSPPPIDNTETLDDKITDIENSLSQRVAKLRGMTLPQQKANAEVAARLVVHLAPRTLHLRNTFEQGMEGVLSTAVEALTDSENFSRLLGLNSSAPSELFREKVAEVYQEQKEFRQSGLPEKVVQRVAFQFAKENFPQLTANIGYLEGALERMIGESAAMARSSHNKGLEGLMNADARKVFLQSLNWSLIAAPAEGAIMPDCVVWGLLEDGTPAPYMLAGQKELTTVVMPISTSHLLVGVRKGQALPDLASINAHAAACSHEFYGAYDNTLALAKHAAYIADRSQQVITDALQGARETLLPAQTEQFTGETGAPEWEISSQSGGFNVQVSFKGEYEQAVAEEIAAGIGTVIRHLSAMMPLARLEKVIVGEKIENNALLAVTERYWNDSEIKCAIVVSADVGQALTGEAGTIMQQAIHVLAFQLAHVAYTDVMFKALPQTFTEPATRPFDK